MRTPRRSVTAITIASAARRRSDLPIAHPFQLGESTMSVVPSRITAVVCSIALLGVAGLSCAQDIPPIGFKKTLENESDKSPDRTPASEAFLIRAYPETDIPTDASFAAISGWSKLN